MWVPGIRSSGLSWAARPSTACAGACRGACAWNRQCCPPQPDGRWGTLGAQSTGVYRSTPDTRSERRPGRLPCTTLRRRSREWPIRALRQRFKAKPILPPSSGTRRSYQQPAGAGGIATAGAARRDSGRSSNPCAAGSRVLHCWSYCAGAMLLFSRNKLSGSYRCLTSTSLCRFSPKAARTSSPAAVSSWPLKFR
jgi:hypothetical protein